MEPLPSSYKILSISCIWKHCSNPCEAVIFILDVGLVWRRMKYFVDAFYYNRSVFAKRIKVSYLFFFKAREMLVQLCKQNAVYFSWYCLIEVHYDWHPPLRAHYPACVTVTKMHVLWDSRKCSLLPYVWEFKSNLLFAKHEKVFCMLRHTHILHLFLSLFLSTYPHSDYGLQLESWSPLFDSSAVDVWAMRKYKSNQNHTFHSAELGLWDSFLH